MSGRRDGGRARGEPIVDAVLASTIDELTKYGFDGMSVERIATKADVNKTSVYRRWPTREKLANAALERILVDVSAAVPDTGSLRGDLLGLLAPVARLLESPLGLTVARFAIAQATASGAHALVARQLQHTAKPLRAVVERAGARGEWRRDADAGQLVFMLVGALLHRALLEHAPLGPSWLGRLVDLAVEGVRPRGVTGPVLTTRGASRRRAAAPRRA